MPYRKITNLPPSIRHSLPKGAQTLFLKAFNGAFHQYKGDESLVFKVAWSAVKKSYRKNAQGKWVKKKK